MRKFINRIKNKPKKILKKLKGLVFEGSYNKRLIVTIIVGILTSIMGLPLISAIAYALSVYNAVMSIYEKKYGSFNEDIEEIKEVLKENNIEVTDEELKQSKILNIEKSYGKIYGEKPIYRKKVVKIAKIPVKDKYKYLKEILITSGRGLDFKTDSTVELIDKSNYDFLLNSNKKLVLRLNNKNK